MAEGKNLQTPKLFEYKYEIDGMELSEGISNVDSINDEDVQEYQYLAGKGVAEKETVGQTLGFTFTGHAKYGDPAQDKVRDALVIDGDNRRIEDFSVTAPNGNKMSGPATMTEIIDGTGEANARAEFGVTITWSGKPKKTKGEA